ncbi:hypothetical protein [Pseudoxanthomonas indica]|uniref:Uncharacterized protein n=1 Tax=Pseudoxanthomonas indica TaxID=428993 RepID=A0A1T5LW03_9GAMM|nr:hypothetical protein [Pseudoxanthomonas indica]GGD40684.1 hypothetical protein GCM10007235_10900 [Pseudoxanthomonas indica]SKC80141.1 hypothetical protein SAMN06296058_3221 [Pseudoxanthomonas indica]
MNEAAENIVVAHIRTQLPDVGEGLAGQLADLARDATPERCERLLVNLRGVQAQVLRLREGLMREGREQA